MLNRIIKLNSEEIHVVTSEKICPPIRPEVDGEEEGTDLYVVGKSKHTCCMGLSRQL